MSERPEKAGGPAYHAHPDYLALLAAVRAAPDDDLPRLVLADWLEENGYAERAELIRVQCATLATVPCGQVGYPLADFPDLGVGCLDFTTALDDMDPDWCTQCRSRHRATQLTGRLGAKFGGPDVRGMAEPSLGNGLTADLCVSYTRGMVADVRGPFTAWVAHADRILPESVGLTVRLTDCPGIHLEVMGGSLAFGLGNLAGCCVDIRAARGEHGCDDREAILRIDYPEVARWELPPAPEYPEYTQSYFARRQHGTAPRPASD